MMDYLSIIAGNFIQPLATVVHCLVRREREGVPGKTNEGDLDWIFTGILLSTVYFETSLRWTQQHRVPVIDQNEPAPKYYERLRQSYALLPDMGEVFVMRNVIAHGHVYEVQGGGAPSWIPRFLMGKQDSAWKGHLDPGGKTTKSGLNLVPSVMTRADFREVLSRVVQAERALIDEDLMLPQMIDHHPGWPNGDRIHFPDLPQHIK